MNEKKCRINFRVTEEEQEIIRKKYEGSGYHSKSEFYRDQIIYGAADANKRNAAIDGFIELSSLCKSVNGVLKQMEVNKDDIKLHQVFYIKLQNIEEGVKKLYGCLKNY